MVQVKYLMVLWYGIGNILFYCELIQFQNLNIYGIITNASPKSSCLRINNIHRVGHCLQTCMANVDIYYMLSYNKYQQACLCCVDFSGSDIIEPSWNTYGITFCYKGYDDRKDKNCLKYVPEKVTFPEAEARCWKEGGALFKLDSQQKYNILTEYIGEIGKINGVQTWIQAKKNGSAWLFDDGTAMPSDACPYFITNNPSEYRLRFRAKDLKCADKYENKLYDFTCEYHFHIEQ